MLLKFKPITPGLRGTVLVSKKELSKEKPHKSLVKKLIQQEEEITKEELPQEGWVVELKENIESLTLKDLKLILKLK